MIIEQKLWKYDEKLFVENKYKKKDILCGFSILSRLPSLCGQRMLALLGTLTIDLATKSSNEI